MTVTPPDQHRPANFHIVDLFAGPGGLDLAADVLGVPSTGIEWDPNACATHTAAGLRVVEGDVRKWRPADFPANVLAGGPPCQTFTVAGDGEGRRALDNVLGFVDRLVAREDRARINKDLAGMNDERTGLVLEPLRWALSAIDDEKLEPYEAIVLEQVPAVLPVWQKFAEVLREEGYSAEAHVLHTEEFGVPQTRRRAVLIARANKREIDLPATHHRYCKGEERPKSTNTLEAWASMADALPDRADAPFRVVSNYGTGGDPKARGRRRSCEPSATVTGKISRNRVVTDDSAEWELPRFTLSEAGQLQTFPACYPWQGRDIAQQIGNAVPPRLGVHILSAALGLGTPGEDVWERLREWVPPEEGEAGSSAPDGTAPPASPTRA